MLIHLCCSETNLSLQPWILYRIVNNLSPVQSVNSNHVNHHATFTSFYSRKMVFIRLFVCCISNTKYYSFIIIRLFISSTLALSIRPRIFTIHFIVPMQFNVPVPLQHHAPYPVLYVIIHDSRNYYD